ncbi:MAG: hypothetical protein MH252_05530 [Thermosynechococcaceae cyanobacterium MS004]|nr:hypothetical protein [Thermosynechococcaceae cyanobacterium MS004]
MTTNNDQNQDLSLELTDEDLAEIQGGGLFNNIYYKPFPHGIPSDFFKNIQQPVLPGNVLNVNVRQF